MAQIINNTIAVTAEELRAVLSDHQIRQLQKARQLLCIQRACNNRRALYAIQSVPQPFRRELYERLSITDPTAEADTTADLLADDTIAATLLSRAVTSPDDLRFFADYILPEGRHLPLSTQRTYANSAALLRALAALRADHISQRARQSRRPIPASQFFQTAAKAVASLSQTMPHNLPASWRRLQGRLRQFTAEGPASLIAHQFGNTHAAKVVTPQQQSLLISLIGHTNNLPDTTIASLYNTVARQQQWPVITPAAVAAHRSRHDLITHAARQGATRFRLTQTMSVQRSRPSEPCLYWTLDGWTVELLYQSTTTDSQGHRTTTYSNRLSLEVVLDPFNDYPVGYAIGTHETPALVREALREALRHTATLHPSGHMLRTHQLQSDRYAIKTLMPTYAAVADKVTPAAPHNARAKVVEPYFNHLNRTYCQLQPNWSGFGITTDPERQPNSEAVNLRRHSFPSADGCRQQIEAIITAERRAKQPAYQAALAASRQVLTMSAEAYLRHFGTQARRLHRLTQQGIILTLQGQQYQYDTTDLRFRHHAQQAWTLRYDPSDLSTILASAPDDTLVFPLQLKHRQPMALADRQPGDAEQLHRVRQFNQALEAHVAQTFSDHTARAADVIASLPATSDPSEASEQLDILRRLLITDSHGSHKDHLSRARLAAAAPVAETPAPDDYDIF